MHHASCRLLVFQLPGATLACCCCCLAAPLPVFLLSCLPPPLAPCRPQGLAPCLCGSGGSPAGARPVPARPAGPDHPARPAATGGGAAGGALPGVYACAAVPADQHSPGGALGVPRGVAVCTRQCSGALEQARCLGVAASWRQWSSHGGSTCAQFRTGSSPLSHSAGGPHAALAHTHMPAAALLHRRACSRRAGCW